MLAVLGVVHIVQSPEILVALNPWYAVQFFMTDECWRFLALGSVVLAVTGAEALYSDMGHFGRGPMRLSWFGFVMPCLLLNYFGQGAMIMGMDDAAAAEAIQNPFFILAPEMLRLPLVIARDLRDFHRQPGGDTGAFSVTQQAIQLGFIPRLSIRHTSETEAGQIYIPFVNWALMVGGDRAGADLPDLVQPGLGLWHRGDRRDADRHLPAGVLLVIACGAGNGGWRCRSSLAFFIVDGAYFAANITKIPDGGWFPLADRRRRLHAADHLGARAAS